MSGTGYCFDFDGTVTDRELLPHLAASLDMADEIGALTQATIDGHIDFRSSFKLRCRLLAAIPIHEVLGLVEEVRLQPELAEFIRAHRDRCAIVTGNLDCWIAPYVARHLGCRLVSSRARVDGDRLLGIDTILDKGDAVGALRRECGWERVLCVGDGMNDVPMLEQADVAVAFGAVHEPCLAAVERAHYIVHNAGSLCNLISRF